MFVYINYTRKTDDLTIIVGTFCKLISLFLYSEIDGPIVGIYITINVTLFKLIY